MSNRTPSAAAGLDRTRRDERARLRLDGIARVLDSKWRLPGTGVRFGLDPVLNLLPGLGLVASKSVSAYLIWEAHRLGVPTRTLFRMIGHIGVDTVISAVPLAGWVGDVFYRANLRNMTLLREHLDQQHPARR